MFKNVYIEGVGSYHPKRIVSNEYYANHFKQYGMEEHAIGLMEKVGRETRTLAETHETSVTMAVEASIKALKNAKLDAKDIDAIISVSDTPEYLTPCCALIIGSV